MKILLISSPYTEKIYKHVFPLGLAYLASGIKGHEVYLFDPNITENPQEEAEKIVQDVYPDVVGISLRNIDFLDLYEKLKDRCSYLDDFSIFIKKIRQINPMTTIVVGGAGYTIFAKEIIERYKEIDAGFYGEAEISFNQYLENINTPYDVKGLYLRKGDEIVFTGKPDPIDMESIVLPRNLKYLDMDRYESFGVQTKRGCAYQCAYCTYPIIEGAVYRLRSPGKVVDEIESTYNRFGIRSFEFADSVFNAPKNHAEEICNEIIKRRLKVEISAYLRPDNLNKSLLKKLVQAGLTHVSFSADALSQKNLDTLKKNIKPKNMIRSCKLVKKFDLPMEIDLFLDLPFEDLPAIRETNKNMSRIISMINDPTQLMFNFSRIRIYPGTVIHKIAIENKIIDSKNDLLSPTFYRTSPFNLSYYKDHMKYMKLD